MESLSLSHAPRKYPALNGYQCRQHSDEKTGRKKNKMAFAKSLI
jgi:hypothetical protein